MTATPAARRRRGDGTVTAVDRDGLLFLDLRALMAAAYLDGIQHRPPVRPVNVPSRAPRLDDTGRAPLVPYAPNGGDRG